ncbi:MAG: hypothetical protein AAGJ46_05205 [Planctomycetota bacterium]
MRRRSSPSDAFSLFAFQDIITSVTGIILLVTLLLALELVQREQLTDTPGRPSVGVDEQAMGLQRRVAELKTQRDQLNGAVAVLAATPGGVRVKMDELQREIQKLRGMLAELGVPAPTSSTDEPVDEIRADCERLGQQIDSLKGKSLVVYNQAPSASKQGWVIDLSSRAVTVAEMGAAGPPTLEVSAVDAAAKVAAFAETKDAARDYFVVLVRPNTVSRFRAIKTRLAGLGFDLGFDILGEDEVLVAPSR